MATSCPVMAVTASANKKRTGPVPSKANAHGTSSAATAMLGRARFAMMATPETTMGAVAIAQFKTLATSASLDNPVS